MRYEWLTGWGLCWPSEPWQVAISVQSLRNSSRRCQLWFRQPLISLIADDLTPELAADEIEPGDHSGPEPASAEFDPTLLIEQSAALTRLLLAGDASAAHEKFALPYRELVTIQTLRDLSKQLSELFGHDISEITFLQTQFGTIDVRTQTESIQVSHVIDFPAGANKRSPQ